MKRRRERKKERRGEGRRKARKRGKRDSRTQKKKNKNKPNLIAQQSPIDSFKPLVILHVGGSVLRAQSLLCLGV